MNWQNVLLKGGSDPFDIEYICSVSDQAALPPHNFTTRYKHMLVQTIFLTCALGYGITFFKKKQTKKLW